MTGETNAALLESLKASSVRNRGYTNSLLVWGVENQLDRHGYAVGTIDGNIDDQTRRATQVYKNQAGLPRDGQLNFALLDHIECSNQRSSNTVSSSYAQPDESVDDFIDTFRQALEQIN